jgi:hypothetical protein
MADSLINGFEPPPPPATTKYSTVVRFSVGVKVPLPVKVCTQKPFTRDVVPPVALGGGKVPARALVRTTLPVVKDPASENL